MVASQEDARPKRDNLISTETLTQYISYARKHINPELTDEAATELVNCT